MSISAAENDGGVKNLLMGSYTPADIDKVLGPAMAGKASGPDGMPGLAAFEAALLRATKALGAFTGATGKGGTGVGGGNAASGGGGRGGAGGNAGGGGSGGGGNSIASFLPRGLRGAISKFGLPLAIAGVAASAMETYNAYTQQDREEGASYNQGAVAKMSMRAQRQAMDEKSYSGGNVPIIGGLLEGLTHPFVKGYFASRAESSDDLARQSRELAVQQSWHMGMMSQQAGTNAIVRGTRAMGASQYGSTYGGMVSAYEEEKGVADQNAIALQQAQDQFGYGSSRYYDQIAANQTRTAAAAGRRRTQLQMVGREAAISAYGVTQGAKAMGLTANGQGAVGQFGALAASMQPDILRAKEEYDQLQGAFLAAPKGSTEAKIAWNLANQANLKWHGLKDQMAQQSFGIRNQLAGQYAGLSASTTSLGMISENNPYGAQQFDIQASFIPQLIAERNNPQAMDGIRANMRAQQAVNAKQWGQTYYGSTLGTQALDDSATANRMAFKRDYRGAEMFSAEAEARQQLRSLDPTQFAGGETGEDYTSRRRAIVDAGGAAAAMRIKELEMPSPMEISGGISSGYKWTGTGSGVEKEFGDALADEKFNGKNLASGGATKEPKLADDKQKIDDLITKWGNVADVWQQIAAKIGLATY